MRPIWIHRGPPNRTFDGLGCLVGSDGASWAIPAKADGGAAARQAETGIDCVTGVGRPPPTPSVCTSRAHLLHTFFFPAARGAPHCGRS